MTNPITNSNVFINLNANGVIEPRAGSGQSFNLGAVYQFTFNLNYSGGSWSLACENSTNLGVLLDQVQIFGLTGTITGIGPFAGSQGIGTLYSGIFGVPKLNKQLNILLYGTSATALINDQIIAPVNQKYWLSAKTVAQTIASAAGVTLSWMVPDVVLYNFNLEGGMTGTAALQSIASRVGGSVRWDGGTNYVVAYPDYTIGSWNVPVCSLLTSNGVSGQYLADLETGIMNSPYGVSQLNQTIQVVPGPNPGTGATATTPAPNDPTGGNSIFYTNTKNITQKASTRKLLGTSDPPFVVQLDQNVESVWFQFLVDPGQDTSGTGVTSNPSTWFPVAGSSGGQGIFYVNSGTLYLPQASFDSSYFSAASSSAVQGGNFVLNVGVVSKDLSDQIPASQDAALADQAALLSLWLASFRYIKTFIGTINTIFFGSIPLPGTMATAIAEGNTYTGVVESINFSPPGVFSVQIAQYTKANFSNPYAKLGNPLALQSPYNTAGTGPSNGAVSPWSTPTSYVI